MDRRVRDRRRTVARGRGRRRLGVIAAVVLALSLVAGFVWLRSSDVLAVRTIIVPETRRVSEEGLREVTKTALGQNLLRVSTHALEEGLRALPYVRDAAVFRRFPDALEVNLREYEPQVRLKTTDGDIWLLADDGRVLAKASVDGGTLPLFVVDQAVQPHEGEDLAAESVVDALSLAGLVTASATWTTTHPIDRIAVSAAGLVTIRLQGGAEVRLGDPSDLKVKLMVAAMILDRYIREGKSTEYVDVQVPDRAVAKAKTP